MVTLEGPFSNDIPPSLIYSEKSGSKGKYKDCGGIKVESRDKA